VLGRWVDEHVDAGIRDRRHGIDDETSDEHPVESPKAAAERRDRDRVGAVLGHDLRQRAEAGIDPSDS
jgi:hypothetical protein